MNHAQDGALDRYSTDDIADACSWDGDSESFFNALVESGFVDRTNTGHAIHDWHDYAGKLIALRQKDAERKRTSRGKKEESAGHPVDIQWTSDGRLPESIRNPNHNHNPNHNPNPNLYPYKDINGGGYSDQINEIEHAKSEVAASSNNRNSAVNAFGIYEREIGELTHTVSQKLIMLEEDYSSEWLIKGIEQAVFQGVKKISYIEGTLRRWKQTDHSEPWTLERQKGGKEGEKYQGSVRHEQSAPEDKPITGGAVGWLNSPFNRVDKVVQLPNVSG